MEKLSPEKLYRITWPLCSEKCTAFNFGSPEVCNVFCEHKFLVVVNARKGVFETASSSVHSVLISDGGSLRNNLPKTVVIKGGEFGRGPDKFNDSLTKLEYLVTYFIIKSVWDKEGNEIKTHFHDGKFKVRKDHEDYELWKKLEDVVYEFSGSKIVVEPGEWYYIDYSSIDLAPKILNLSPGKLKRWLFNPLSYLYIGSDEGYNFEGEPRTEL